MAEIKTLREEKKAERPVITLDSTDFGKIFRLNAKANMLKKGTDKDFIIDENNKHVINQLYFYISNIEYQEKIVIKDNKEVKEITGFKGDLNKGILLIGKIGTIKCTIIGLITMILRLVNHLVFFEVVRFRRGARISPAAINTKIPKKNPMRILISLPINFQYPSS